MSDQPRTLEEAHEALRNAAHDSASAIAKGLESFYAHRSTYRVDIRNSIKEYLIAQNTLEFLDKQRLKYGEE